MWVIVSTVVWLLLAATAASMAEERGQSPTLWFVIGLFSRSWLSSSWRSRSTVTEPIIRVNSRWPTQHDATPWLERSVNDRTALHTRSPRPRLYPRRQLSVTCAPCAGWGSQLATTPDGGR